MSRSASSIYFAGRSSRFRACSRCPAPANSPTESVTFRFDDHERPEVSLIEVDPYFLRTLGLELVEGEDFPPDLLASGRVALVNQQLSGHAGGTGRRLLSRRRVPAADYWRGLRLPAR